MRRSPSGISDALATKHSGMGQLPRAHSSMATLRSVAQNAWASSGAKLSSGRTFFKASVMLAMAATVPSALRIPRSIAGGADRAPNAVRRRRRVRWPDADIGERIQPGVYDPRRARRDAGLAAALDAQRIALGRIFRQRDVEVRKVIRARHAVVEKACGQKLPRARLVDRRL